MSFSVKEIEAWAVLDKWLIKTHLHKSPKLGNTLCRGHCSWFVLGKKFVINFKAVKIQAYWTTSILRGGGGPAAELLPERKCKLGRK